MSTKAEQRKATFGSKGQFIWGGNIVFLKVSDKLNCFGQELWAVIEEGTNIIFDVNPINIKLDDEPNFALVKFSEHTGCLKNNPSYLVYDNPHKKEKLAVFDIAYFKNKDKYLFYCEDYPDQLRDDTEYLYVKDYLKR